MKTIWKSSALTKNIMAGLAMFCAITLGNSAKAEESGQSCATLIGEVAQDCLQSAIENGHDLGDDLIVALYGYIQRESEYSPALQDARVRQNSLRAHLSLRDAWHKACELTHLYDRFGNQPDPDAADRALLECQLNAAHQHNAMLEMQISDYTEEGNVGRSSGWPTVSADRTDLPPLNNPPTCRFDNTQNDYVSCLDQAATYYRNQINNHLRGYEGFLMGLAEGSIAPQDLAHRKNQREWAMAVTQICTTLTDASGGSSAGLTRTSCYLGAAQLRERMLASGLPGF